MAKNVKGTENVQNGLESMLALLYISNTSNNTSEKYKRDEPTKVCYIDVDDDSGEREKLEDFGIKFYTPKSGERDYGMIRCSKNVAVYDADSKELIYTIDCRVEGEEGQNPNFKTTDDHPVLVNLIKGEKAGNKFTRIQAIQIEAETDIEEIIARNPFLPAETE